MRDPFDLLHVHAEAAQETPEGPATISTELVLHSQGGSRSTAPAARMPLVVSLAGHTDAGTLSEQLAESLLETLPHKQLASFDVDAIYDFRSRRPHITFTDSRFTDYQGLQLNLYEVRDAMDRPFLLLSGDEPDFQWERVSETILELRGPSGRIPHGAGRLAGAAHSAHPASGRDGPRQPQGSHRGHLHLVRPTHRLRPG